MHGAVAFLIALLYTDIISFFPMIFFEQHLCGTVNQLRVTKFLIKIITLALSEVHTKEIGGQKSPQRPLYWIACETYIFFIGCFPKNQSV
jgi:hypothetical protein